MEDYQNIIKKINGMFRPCNDMVKTDPKDIEQENIDNAYNLALSDVLNLFKKNECKHDWFDIKDKSKGKWQVCKKCFSWKKL